ncbi:conserved hypothetical protein [Paraburkholderia tropica]|nr:conserved hypothetical protein [Paraburkholderia tropica]
MKAVPRKIDLRDARRFDLQRMMDLLRLRLVDVAAAFVMPSGKAHLVASPSLRWCARCARDGVHLTAFQYYRLGECPFHHVPLREYCEQCGAAIPYCLRADLFRTPFSCPTCSHPWCEPASGIDDLRLRRRQRWQAARCAPLTLLPTPSFVLQTDVVVGTFDPLGGQVARGRANSLHAVAAPWITFGLTSAMTRAESAGNVWAGVNAPGDFPDSTSGHPDDAQARSCYKAVLRRIAKTVGRAHRRCVRLAVQQMCVPMRASAATPWCPVAHAMLRWRCKWEGVGQPGSLFQQPFHGPLGLAIWLSLDAPIAPASWSREAGQWLTLHGLTTACLDSFYTYLVEARSAGASQHMQWLPFPVRDFSSRAVVVRDTGTAPGAAQLCVIALDPSHVERPLISELGLPLTKLPSSGMRCASVAQIHANEHQLKKRRSPHAR